MISGYTWKAVRMLRCMWWRFAFGDRRMKYKRGESARLQLRTRLESLDQGVRDQRGAWPAVSGGLAVWRVTWTAISTYRGIDWALEAIHSSSITVLCRLFSTYADLTGETATSYSGIGLTPMSTSFAWNYLHQPRTFCYPASAA